MRLLLLTLSILATYQLHAQYEETSIDEDLFCRELTELMAHGEAYFEEIMGEQIDSATGTLESDFYASPWSFSELRQGVIEVFMFMPSYNLVIDISSDSPALIPMFNQFKEMIGTCLGEGWMASDVDVTDRLVRGIYFLSDELGVSEVTLTIEKLEEDYILKLMVYAPL